MNATAQAAKAKIVARTPERMAGRALFHSQLLQHKCPTGSSRQFAVEIDERFIHGNGKMGELPGKLQEGMLFHHNYYLQVFRTLAHDVAQQAAIEANIRPGAEVLFERIWGEFSAAPHMDQYLLRVALMARQGAGLEANEKLRLHQLALNGDSRGRLLSGEELQKAYSLARPDPALVGIAHKTPISAAGDVIRSLEPHIDKFAGNSFAKDAASELVVCAFQALWKIQRYLANKFNGDLLNLDVPPKFEAKK